MPDSPTRRSLWRRLALGLVPLVVLLLLAELLLWALAGESDRAFERSRGFDPQARYLVADPARPGAFRTQIFSGNAVNEFEIPPKSAARRVLLFGGSNTMQFPEYVLQEELARLAPEHEWEVINLGRAGYGSQRVAILFEQALQLEPDLMLVYSGHNEFVERGFAAELIGARPGDWQESVLSVAQNLRSYRWLAARLREPAENPLEATAPELAAEEPLEFEGLEWWQTLRFFDELQANLERMAQLARDANTPLILCTPLRNDLTAPRVSTSLAAIDPSAVERHAELLTQALELVPRRFLRGVVPPDRLRVSNWYTPDARAPKVALRTLLGELADAPAFAPRSPLRRNGVPNFQDRKAYSVAGAHWPPPEYWDDKVQRVLASVQQLSERALEAQEREALSAALDLLGSAAEIAPDHAEALFLEGLVRWLLGDDDALALATLRAAASTDRAPRAANDSIIGRIHRVAENSVGTQLLDTEAWLRARHPDGLVSYETMMDHCHLQPGVRVELMRYLARELVARDW